MICPHCGTTHPAEAEFCPITGKPLLVKNVCKHCGEKLELGAQFCPLCGKEQFKSKQRIKVALYIAGLVVLIIIIALFAQLIWPRLFLKKNLDATSLVLPHLSTPVPAQIILTSTGGNTTSLIQLLPSSTPEAVDTPTLSWQPSITSSPDTPVSNTLPAEYECPDKNQIKLRIGSTGMVQKFDVNLRKEPVVPNDYYINVVTRLSDGAKVTVLDGPTCAYDGSWWKVETESNDIGWVREIQPSKGTLIILAEPSPTPNVQGTQLSSRLGVGSTLTRPADNTLMVYVPGGPFTMGNDNGYNMEKPTHEVTLDPYWIDKTDVTNAMFQNFVNITQYKSDAEIAGTTQAFNSLNGKDINSVSRANWLHPHGPTSDLSGLDNHPVVQVSWNDASAYCTWAGARLPTEAEWEKAARGTDGRIYPWGNQVPDGSMANLSDVNLASGISDKNINDGYKFTSPICNYPKGDSPFGACDMAGNVWQWVSDWYEATYYFSSPSTNPFGPNGGTYRVFRGGSWYSVADFLRTTDREGSDPSLAFDFVGFRCAMSVNR